MESDIDEMLVEVRASTSGFTRDIAQMRSAVDSNLSTGFARAGDVLERSLLNAIRRGSFGFDDLKSMAFSVIDQIASHAIKAGLAQIFAGISGGKGGGSGLANFFAQAIGAASSGAPGRATGGPVSPGRGYLVGERGPELFVPTSAGRVEPDANTQRAGRAVNVSISLAAPRGTSAPIAMRRSSRQIAAAVRRSLAG